jgi:hypothetical protein
MKTGYEDWDQNLKTLSQSLFPDPSKAAHAYYYGAEARKAQLDAAKTQDQMAAGHTALGMQFGRVPNPTYQPGFGGTQIMVDPNSQPAPGPAPAAGPGPTGLGAAVTAMPPQAVANGVVAGVENNAQSGTLPPMAPPTPSSPPEPTTTASNGTTPSNSPATLHPGSVTSAGGGGVIMAGPAAADGTPAPAAFNMGQLIALQIAAGATPEAAYATARGTLGNMVKNGQIALPLAEQMAAFYGAPQMRVQTLTNEGNLAVGAQTQAGATQRTAMEQAGQTQRTGMTEAGATQRTGMALQDIVAPTDPTQITRVPLAQLQGPGGTPSYNPNAVTAGVAPVLVQPGGPGTAPYSQPAFRAQQPQGGQPGMPTYQAGTEDIRQTQLGAVHNWVDPKNPTQMIPGTVEEARQNGWTAPPTTSEGWSALAASASANAPPDQAQQIRDKVLQFAATTTPKPVTAEETNREQRLLDNQLANHLPVPAGEFVKEPWWTNKLPAGSSPALGAVLSDLTDQYYRYDPETRGNQVTSANKAIKQLIEEKRINPAQGRTTGWISDEKTINKTVLTKDGPQQVPHFRVDLLDEAGKPIKEGQPVPRIMMRRLSNAVMPAAPAGPAPRGPAPLVTGRPPGGPAAAAPAAPAAGAPAGAIGAARPGTPDGPATIGGKPVVVRGGYIFPG